MALTFRDGLGRALTHTELDTNFRELYYSSSYTSHSISLFKSKSLNAETILPVNQARGSKYSIQVKSGSEALGTGSIATGSSYFLWNYNQKKLIVTGSGNITGDLTVGGTVFAQEFKTELISSSIIFDSGSTKFGDSLDDFHDFTGSVSTTGSGALIGNYTQTGNNTTVGKLELTGSNLHLGNTTRIGNTNLTGVLQSTGNTILSGSTHTVTGNVTHVGNVNQTGNTTINGSILHTGSLTHSGSISINSTGNVTLTGGVTQTGLLTRTGETQLTGNLKVTGSGVVSSNLQVAGNLQVNGTGSFGYVQTITGSAKIIGDAFLILNNNTPTARYAGIKVIDSGSSNVTASLQFDGSTNDWFQEYEGGADDHKVVIFGPSYPTKGTPIYPLANQIQKGTGTGHLTGSNITDNGSTVTVTSGVFAIPGITNVSSSISAASGGSTNIVDDNAPKLGGNLDINSRIISGSGGININGNITGLKITGSNAKLATLNVNTPSAGTTNAILISRDTQGEAGVIKQVTGGIEIHSQKNLTLGADEDGSYTGGSSNVIFKTDGTEKARIDSDGNIGIGTDSPNAKLDVNGAVVIAPNTDGKQTFEFTTNATNDARLLMKSDTTVKVEIQANNNTYFNGGNVGIGTTTPDALLNIESSNVDTARIRLGCTKDGTWAVGNTIGSLDFFSADTTAPGAVLRGSVSMKAEIASGADTGMAFATYNNTERMRIAANGNVGIGTSAPAAKLDVAGDIRATGDITAYYSSDERLKDNVTPISNPIEKLKSIGGYEFDWNSKSNHEGHDVGVIAQEIEAILPEIVVDRDNGYKAVRYEKIVALLIEAIKDQQGQIDELKSKL